MYLGKYGFCPLIWRDSMNKPAAMTIIEINDNSFVVEHHMIKVSNDVGHVMELNLDTDGDIVPKYEREQVEKGIYKVVGEAYVVRGVDDIKWLCDCKKGFKNPVYDGRGLFLCYACDKCLSEKMKGYRADIMEPDYWHDEPIDCE
jgi:hypothetical protein